MHNMIRSAVSKSTRTVDTPFSAVFGLLGLFSNANFKSVSLHYVTKNNVNDVAHTLEAKGEKCLLKYSFKSLPSR